MKKIASIAAILALSAGSALAGGLSAPVVEGEPVVVEDNATSGNGLLVPGLLALALIGAAVAASDGGGGSSGSTNPG
ncbi:MAG: hypothetical protein CVT84_08565 [Alphaproteobacteria bacterium HGW-Alphaproteobacteria-6]|nr:MAG: hypothetical protein CVT84_08565 [Alphaproteobacteria bacterium HGW-Alphaproteobacteria-6]